MCSWNIIYAFIQSTREKFYCLLFYNWHSPWGDLPWQVRSTLIPHYVNIYNSHNTQLTCWFLRREENWRTWRKTIVARERTTHQTNSTHIWCPSLGLNNRTLQIWWIYSSYTMLFTDIIICHRISPLSYIFSVYTRAFLGEQSVYTKKVQVRSGTLQDILVMRIHLHDYFIPWHKNYSQWAENKQK
jgi:hypothetical protein